MDNVCHTLVGAACAEAGLKTRTRFATAALLIAANLPDLDVLVFATDTAPVSFRRGWTHGALAQATLPILFTGALLLIDRMRPRREAGPPARTGALLLISYIGVLSHVFLDFLNNYGVRLLMPFSDRWFYGDAVFIVDPWLWLTLGAGVFIARRRGSMQAARRSLIVATGYILLMLASAFLARQMVIDEWMARNGTPPRALMVGPAPVDPFRKTVIVDAGDAYAIGTFTWVRRRTDYDPERVPKHESDAAVQAVRSDAYVRAVLTWARFPYFQVLPSGDGRRVLLRDLRFGARIGAVSIDVPD